MTEKQAKSPGKASLKKPKIKIILSSESPDLYTTKRLLEEAQKLKHSTAWINPYQHLISLKKNQINLDSGGLYLHRTSGTRYDDFDLLVAKEYQQQGFKISNPFPAIDLFRKKDEQALFFNKHQIDCPDSIIYRGELNQMMWEQICTLSKNEKFILKMVRGNQGIGVNLIQGVQSLKSLLETFHALRDQKFLIQPYIEHKKEWRLFILKKNILGIIERNISKEDFRGNSKRSKGKIVKKIPKQLETMALHAANLSGLDYCGIDVLEDKNKFLILEINAVPGFLQVEELSGINVAHELITNLIGQN